MSTYCACSPQRSSVLWLTEAPHINRLFPTKRFHTLIFLKLYNCWWKRQIDIITSTWTHWMNDGPHCLMWTVLEMCLFLAIILQMRHGQRDGLKDYWSTLEQKPFRETLWNETDFIIYWDICILVKIKMNLTREMKITTDCGKWELYLTSSMIRTLNVTV